jgi:hypothetical protein
MDNNRLIWGWVLIALGIIWTGVCFFTTFFMLIYSIPLVIIGIFILLNKKEDLIEKRKDLKEKEYTK